MVYMLNLDVNTFMHIVGSLESGLKGLDTSISTQVFKQVIFLNLYVCPLEEHIILRVRYQSIYVYHIFSLVVPASLQL